jgi:hypothetical protein
LAIGENISRHYWQHQADNHGGKKGKIFNHLVGSVINSNIAAALENGKENGVHFEIEESYGGSNSHRQSFFDEFFPIIKIDLNFEFYVFSAEKENHEEVENHIHQKRKDYC